MSLIEVATQVSYSLTPQIKTPHHNNSKINSSISKKVFWLSFLMTEVKSLDTGLSDAKTRSIATFGLTRDLKQPIMVKICYLECTNPHPQLATMSEKLEDPKVFKNLSKIYRNSDLFVQVELFDGKNNNPLSTPVQTSYRAFNNKRRLWNQYLKLMISYNQVYLDSYLKFTLLEIVETKPEVFGVGYISLFNTRTSTLRTGSQKIPVYTKHGNGVDIEDVRDKLDYTDSSGLTDIEKNLIKYENGEYPRISWLDKLALPQVSASKDVNKDHNYYLYIEMPNLEFPFVYSDITYNVPTLQQLNTLETGVGATAAATAPGSKIINSIDIPMSSVNPKLMKIYDPDFDVTAKFLLNNNNFNSNANDIATTTNNAILPGYDTTAAATIATNSTPIAAIASASATNMLDPIELKFHKLERNINNNSIIDKDLKPTPQLRDELHKILLKPSNSELSDNEKNLLWRFRYYFSKNNSLESSSNASASKSFLPKFLKSINWENDYELNHTFKEILPLYWNVDKLQVGDALELLDNYFNPYTLTQGMLSEAAELRNDYKLKDEEARFRKVFNHVSYLRKLAVERLRKASSEELMLYLLQLVQALKYEALMYREQFSSDEENDSQSLNLPLADFLIESAVKNESLGNFFYWYVKVENEDYLNKQVFLTNLNAPLNPPTSSNSKNKNNNIYAFVLNKYIESLKLYCHENKLPYYKHLKRQIWFIKKLTNLVELLRKTFKKNEATMRKVEFLRDYLSASSNELLKFPEPFPLPLDPSVIVCGCYPQESSVFKSSLAPLKITLKTLEGKKTPHSSQVFGRKTNKHGKYPLMFKIGDDLRQDQLVIQIINLMDQLLKNENLDLKLTPYKILATSPVAGLIQFVPNETLDSILSKNSQMTVTISEAMNTTETSVQQNASGNGILNYLRLHSREKQPVEPISKSVLHSVISSTSGLPNLGNNAAASRNSIQTVVSDLGVSPALMDNYVKSCAGYCVITYILGVGDRHLDNLLLSPNGKFWHADFGYILGRDPKPFPPLMKLPIQVIDGMGGLNHENYNIFKSYCFITYSALRKNSNLILNLFQLMLDANIPDITVDPSRVISKVQEKFCLQMTEEEAILHFQNLINDSVNAFLPVVIDRLHSLAQYWRA